MIIPFAIGTLGGLLLIAVYARKYVLFAITAAFISGALASKAAGVYAYFVPMYVGALTLWVLTHESERIIERLGALYLGILMIWASDNSAIVSVIKDISLYLVAPLFAAVSKTLEVAFGAGIAALLAWAIVSPRLLSVTEEAPLVGIGYVVLGNIVLSALVSGIPDYLRLALGIALLPELGRALRGNLEALGGIAPVLYLIPIDPAVLAQIGAVVSIVELALGIISRKHLGASAMWATAITLV
ncbi:MAG: hypothetical protein ABWK05_07135 [Pyrobaculum sp.]